MEELKLLFKPVLDEEKRLVVVFNVETVDRTFIDKAGAINNSTTLFFDMIDIQDTVDSGRPALDRRPMDNDWKSKFTPCEVSLDDPSVMTALNICLGQLEQIQTSAVELYKIVNVLMPKQDVASVSIIPKDVLIDGPLNDYDWNRIFPVLLNVMIQNVDRDHNDDEVLAETVEKIKQELANVLPPSVDIEDIEIKEEGIRGVMKDIQNQIHGKNDEKSGDKKEENDGR